MSKDRKRIVEQLGQLVATASVSSTDQRWDQSNRGVIDLLAGWAATLGFSVEIMPVGPSAKDRPGKANLIATLGSGPGGLVLAGHTDTVPFDEGRWQSDPLSLTLRDDCLYGLGATDMKGFFPLALAAAARHLDKPLRQPLILLATADEESSMSGARALAAAGRPRARAAIIGEPTGLRPVNMHKGIMMHAVRIVGRSGHSSDPSLGNNALDAMHAVIGELLSFRGELARRFSNPGFAVAQPTLNLGCLHGGDNPNRICGAADLHFDLRMTPEGGREDLRQVLAERLDRIAGERNIDIELRDLIEQVPPFEQSADSELLRTAEQLTGHSPQPVGFATEAPFLQQLGMETVVMGPGSIDRAHQPDEYLETSQIYPCIDLLDRCIAHYCH